MQQCVYRHAVVEVCELGAVRVESEECPVCAPDEDAHVFHVFFFPCDFALRALRSAFEGDALTQELCGHPCVVVAYGQHAADSVLDVWEEFESRCLAVVQDKVFGWDPFCDLRSSCKQVAVDFDLGIGDTVSEVAVEFDEGVVDVFVVRTVGCVGSDGCVRGHRHGVCALLFGR